jgi:YidC/Oxa1 family membrane protein insertase
MNDIRRTILWVIFGFSLVLLWDQWQVFNGNKPTFLPSTKPAAVAANTPADAAPGAGSSVPAAAPAGAGAVPTQTAPAAPREQVSVTTDLFKAVIDGEGATVNHLELLQYEETEGSSKHVVLFDNSSPATRYVAQTGLLNQGGSDRFPNHLTPMTPKAGPREMAPGQDTLEVSFESEPSGGLKYVKTYVFRRADYAIRVRHEVVNVSDQPRDAQLYLQLLRHGTVASSTMFGTNTFTGPAAYTEEKKFHKLDFADITKNKVEPPPAANDGWIAMVQHYFVSAWLLKGDPASEQLRREFRVKDLGNNLYTVAMVATLPKIDPGQTQVVNTALFAGPEEEQKLEAIAPGLDLVKDYGIFAIISKPLYWLLYQLHGILGNWGWAIVALVVLLKAAFYWLNAKAYASMAKMKAVNPKIMEMRERLKDKPQEMQQEMMRIYKTEKVNPMGGCFPILIQIPVFIALYWVLLSSVEMRHAPWIGWITDLSAPDPWYILPIVMTLTSLFQTWLNPTPPDPMQAKLMWIMPLAFSVMFIFFPAGLVLYWITNNVLSIAQQWFINKRLGVLGK